MPEVLPELVIYALLFFAVAFAFAARKLTQALFGPLISALQSIPVIGSKLAAPFHAIEQAVTGACYSIENGADKAMGAIWHRTVELLNWTWREVKRHALVGVETALYIPLLISAFHNLRNLVHRLSHIGHGVTAAVKTLEREYHGIEHRVKVIEREIGAGIGHDLRIHIKALEKWEKAAKAQLADDARAIAETIPAEITQLERFIKALPGTSYLDWAAGIVATAIGLDIFNLFKCPSLLNSAKKRGCGLWNGLEDVLSLFVDAVIFVDLCKIIPEAVTLFGEFEAPLTELISGAANAACARKPNGWVMPMVAAGPLPPAQSLGPLAEG